MIRRMRAEDWPRVAAIYEQGIETGYSTFNTTCPTYEQWNGDHLEDCRFVWEEDGIVAGWIAMSPVSSRCCYAGCAELSVYIDKAYRGRGIGTELIKALLRDAQDNGYWSIRAEITSINEGSIALHKKCGFRYVGYRERIARDRFGVWQNTTIMEYRLPDPAEE